MTTTRATDPTPTAPPEVIPPLRDGDRLTRAEFERRYNAMPGLNKAELVEGVVYMPSPVSDDHGTTHFDLITLMGMYRFATAGVVGSDNGSIRLEPESMPQPDLFLRILETHGGRSRRTADGYIAGGPELVVEVAVTNVNFDVTVKLPMYQRNGVREYVVWRVADQAVDWFILREGQYQRLPLTEGVYRSEVLPGLWLDPVALVGGDVARLVQVVQRGIASPEHAGFLQRLQAQAEQTTPPAP
jgi:Uma2 family endonuclease